MNEFNEQWLRPDGFIEVSFANLLACINEVKRLRGELDGAVAMLAAEEQVRGSFASAEAVVAHIRQANDDEEAGRALRTSTITRVEVIDEDGRSYVHWKDRLKITTSLQDDGRTLKIFIAHHAPPILSVTTGPVHTIGTVSLMPEDPPGGVSVVDTLKELGDEVERLERNLACQRDLRAALEDELREWTKLGREVTRTDMIGLPLRNFLRYGFAQAVCKYCSRPLPGGFDQEDCMARPGGPRDE